MAASSKTFDLAVIGAGIVGLAHALAATRLGLSVAVIDRDARASGASVRNFGFVTVSGQEPGTMWRRALRSRDVWLEMAVAAGIDVLHRGALIVARRPEAFAVLEAFRQTEMGEACELLSPPALAARQPVFDPKHFAGALFSPHEIRVESNDAIPRIAAWLEQSRDVEFHREAAVHSVAPPEIETSRGPVHAARVVVCPGDDLTTLFPERIASYNVTRCKLHMMRLADPGFRLGTTVMSDLSLARYPAFAALPQTAALLKRLEAEEKPALDNGVHLIAVQSADGSLVVGDSHHYGTTPEPFNDAAVDDLILAAYRQVFAGTQPKVMARWTGTYARADRGYVIDTPSADIRLVMNTAGNGASTAFAVAEEVIAGLFNTSAADLKFLHHSRQTR